MTLVFGSRDVEFCVLFMRISRYSGESGWVPYTPVIWRYPLGAIVYFSASGVFDLDNKNKPSKLMSSRRGKEYTPRL